MQVFPGPSFGKGCYRELGTWLICNETRNIVDKSATFPQFQAARASTNGEPGDKVNASAREPAKDICNLKSTQFRVFLSTF